LQDIEGQDSLEVNVANVLSKLTSLRESLENIFLFQFKLVNFNQYFDTAVQLHFLKSRFLKYKGASKSFRTERLERELQMVQLSATRCSCIALL
jgi:hypothetical protein